MNVSAEKLLEIIGRLTVQVHVLEAQLVAQQEQLATQQSPPQESDSD